VPLFCYNPCMCGAFTFTQFTRIVKEQGLKAAQEFMKERFNLRPTDYVPTVLNNSVDTIFLAYWGMTPSWGKDKKIPLLFNTRADSIVEKPYFNKLMKKNRCIILADGFYEWEKSGNEKLPHRFILKNHEPFAFAGIWDYSPINREPQVSIITTEPNSLVARIHNRMPVILTLDRAKNWIQNDEEQKLIEMLKPIDERMMDVYRVSKDVNYSANDSPELILPIEQIKAA